MNVMLLEWLRPPAAESPYQDFKQRALHYTLLSLLLFLIPATLVGGTLAGLWFRLFSVVLLVFSHTLLHTQRPTLAMFSFLVGAWVIITAAALTVESFRLTGLGTYAIIIIYSALLFPGFSVIGFTALCIVSATVLQFGAVMDPIPPTETDFILTGRLLPNIALYLSIGLVSWLTANASFAVMAELETSQKDIKEHNKRLQAEIDERRRAEADSANNQEKYRILFEHSNIGATVYNESYCITLINETAAQYMGRTVQDLEGQHVSNVLPQPLAERAIQRMTRVRDSGVLERVEGRLFLPNGQPLDYITQIVCLPKTREGTEVLILTLDVTAQKISEAQELALKLAAEKADFLTEFFGTISHDLKTPLTVLNTTLYLLERSKTEEQRARGLQQMRENIAVIQQYIQDMLTYARLEHAPDFVLETVHTHELLQTVVERLQPRADHKKIVVRTELSSILPYVSSNTDQLQRALLNLIENAIAYTPDGGSVTIRTITDDKQVTIEISDTGVGIEPEDLDRIFNRFYRGASAQQLEQSGSGLGLAIVKKIIDMSNGDISVSSIVGSGTTFTLKLPIMET